MVTVALFNSCVVFLAYLARHKRTEYWLIGSFVLIFLFLALRYNFGNDYHVYLEKFIEINQQVTIDYNDANGHFEPGWVFLCRLFDKTGFFSMVAVLALFNCIVYYHFIKKYVPPKHYWFAVFLYVFNPEFMLIHCSAMRQSIAIALFVFSIDYLYKRDAIRYFLCIGLASLFHSSALVLFPVYLLGMFNWKINKIAALSLFSMFLLLILFGKSFLAELNLLITLLFLKYQVYEGGGEVGTGLGLVFQSILFIIVLFRERLQIAENSLLFKIAVVSYFVMPIGILIMMLGRVGMYFQPATLAVFPIITLGIKNKLFKNMFRVSIIFITLYSFYIFFHSEVWIDYFGTYQTILSAPELI